MMAVSTLIVEPPRLWAIALQGTRTKPPAGDVCGGEIYRCWSKVGFRLPWEKPMDRFIRLFLVHLQPPLAKRQAEAVDVTCGNG